MDSSMEAVEDEIDTKVVESSVEVIEDSTSDKLKMGEHAEAIEDSTSHKLKMEEHAETIEDPISDKLKMEEHPQAVEASTSSKLKMEDHSETDDGKMEIEESETEVFCRGIEDMPDHILFKIFDYLTMPELATCTHVCTRWHDALSDWKSVWRNKKYYTEGTINIEELQSIVDVMPRLKCLHIATAMKTAAHIDWPEAMICLLPDSSGRRVQRTTEFVKFDTETVIVGIFAFPAFPDWAKCETIRKIYVADPCFILRNSRETPFYFGDRPDHGVTCDPKVYCVFCTYNHHRSCTGPACSLRKPIDQCGHPWCDEEKLNLERRVSRKPRRIKIPACRPEDGAQPGTSAEGEKLLLPSLKEANVLCTFLAAGDFEFLFKSCRPKVLKIGCRLYRFPFLRHVQSSLEELTVTSNPVLPPSAVLCELRRLKVLRVSHIDDPEARLEDLFQRPPENPDGTPPPQ